MRQRIARKLDLERGMNAEQLAAVRHDAGPAQLLAGAGSGKTRVVVHRAARLVESGVDPARVFLVTFSTKAAAEMTARVAELGHPEVTVKTWHGFAWTVLKQDGTAWGKRQVDDKDREKTLVKQALGYKHLRWEGADLREVRSYIGHCKANLLDASSEGAQKLARETFGRDWELAVRAHLLRDEMMRDAGLIGFDDMLVACAEHFRDEEARRAWASRFEHVMTDEFQDNNLAQVALTSALACDHRNVMVVGDVRQAIYSFRGSSPEHALAFPEQWEATTRISLARNYRSGKRIVDVANAVIAGSPRFAGDPMIAERTDVPGKATLLACHDFDDEASEVAGWIKAQVAAGRKASDCTVLFRTNGQSRALEDALLREKLPYLIVGATNFWERKEVKDLLAYLRVAAGRDFEGDGVRRCVNAPFRFLGAKFVERLTSHAATWAANHGATPAERALAWPSLVSEVARQDGLQSRQRESALEWAEIIKSTSLAIAHNDHKAADVLDDLVRRTGYLRWLEKEEGEESVENSHAANVREMLRVALSFGTVPEFLDYVDQAVRDSAKAKRSKGDRALLMSVHRSKGLEWPCVWVVGCNEKILPHAKGDPEEERRLMYVAVTRARDELVCSHVASLATKAGVSEAQLSRFLADPAVRALFDDLRRPRDENSSSHAPASTLPAPTDVPDPDPSNGEETAGLGSDHGTGADVSARYDALEATLTDDSFTVRFTESWRKTEAENPS